MSIKHYVAVAALALGFSTGAGDLFAADNGTALSVENTNTSMICQDDGNALVSITSTLHTTGSVDSAVVSRAINGIGETEVGTIVPQEFEHAGRNKSASFADTVALPNGSYTLTYCFTQSGSKGREPKVTCGDIDVVVDCSTTTSTCGDSDNFFGNIIGNNRLCNGNGTPHIPVHLKADAAGDVTLDITGPDNFTLTTIMNRSGASCNYHFVWDTRSGAHGGEGSYTFTATDDAGQIATTTTDLHCPSN